jgi:hypothetical protein
MMIVIQDTTKIVKAKVILRISNSYSAVRSSPRGMSVVLMGFVGNKVVRGRFSPSTFPLSC